MSTTSIEGNDKPNAIVFLLMTNPINLPFEKKVELQYSSQRIPVGEGVIFIDYREVPVEDIQQRTIDGVLNRVRAEGLIQETVAAFVDRINEGRYLFTYEQPIVCEVHGAGYELICGEHRLQAHKLAGRKTMFVAVVKFESTEARLVFQSNENDEDDEYVKAIRTENDVVLTLTEMVNEGIIDIDDDKSINARLIKLRQKTGDFPTLREKLRSKFGKITPVKSYCDETRREWVQEYKSNIEFSSRTNVKPVEGVAYISKTFKGGSGKGGLRDLDYDPRCFFDDCFLLQQEGIHRVVNIASVNGATSEKLPQIRNYKNTKMIGEWQSRIVKIADDIRDGKIDPVNQIDFKWTPQIDSVDNMEEWA
jgi:hypothetical protein